MEAQKVPSLYFIGEVVDAGHLSGFISSGLGHPVTRPRRLRKLNDSIIKHRMRPPLTLYRLASDFPPALSFILEPPLYSL